MVMQMIKIRNVWSALVIGVCLMSGCASSGLDSEDVGYVAPQAIQAAAESCPVGTVSVCSDRLPRGQACACASDETLRVPASLPGGVQLR